MRQTPSTLASTLVAALVCASALTAEDAPLPTPSTLDRDALARVVNEFFEREMVELGVPGAAFAMVSGGETVLLRGWGFADLDAKRPMDPRRSVVRVGSVSKPVTALAALQLVERGELDLHRDIAERLGDKLIPPTFDEPVTLHHLLSQSAGFGERLFGQHTLEAEDHLALRTFLERHLTRRVRPPGLVINYNDYQTSLAGLLVETASGVPFAESARELVFAPLGMTTSTFEQVELPRDLESRLSLAYRAGDIAIRRDYVHTTPAAGLYTTAEDMGRFVAALLTDGANGAVSEPAIRKMKETQFRHGPFMAGRGYGLAEGHLHGYRTLHKDGQCSGFTARILLVPELGVGWFSVQTLSIFGRAGAIGRVNGLHRRLAAELLRELFPEGVRAETPSVRRAASDVASLDGLAGTFRDTMDPTDGWEGLLLANEVRVDALRGGTLRFLGIEPWQRTTDLQDDRPVHASTFFHREGEDGDAALMRFVRSDETAQQWVTYGAGAWERLPWYRTARFTRLTGAACLAVLLTAPFAALWRRRRRARKASIGALRGTFALTGMALLYLLFVLGLGTALLVTDVQALYSGVTPLLRFVFLLPPLALGLAVVGLVRLFLSRPPALAAAYWTLVGMAGLAVSLLLALHRALGWPL